MQLVRGNSSKYQRISTSSYEYIQHLSSQTVSIVTKEELFMIIDMTVAYVIISFLCNQPRFPYNVSDITNTWSQMPYNTQAVQKRWVPKNYNNNGHGQHVKVNRSY